MVAEAKAAYKARSKIKDSSTSWSSMRVGFRQLSLIKEERMKREFEFRIKTKDLALATLKNNFQCSLNLQPKQ
jgi:hypothetical protein